MGRQQIIQFAAILVVVTTGVVAAGLAIRGRPAAPDVAVDAPNSEGRAAATLDADGAKISAVCRRVGAPVIPAADRPDATTTAALKGCDAEALYYGEGTAPDYVGARQCAIAQDQRGEDDYFAGKTILMQIYANGLGTERNLDLATAIACDDQAPFTSSGGRILRLQAPATKPVRFDVCDDVYTTYEINECAARDSKIAGLARDRKIETTVGRLPIASAPLFGDVKATFAAFVEAHALGEIDMSGTIRGVLIIGERDSEGEQFLKDLNRLADGTWPGASSAETSAADSALNRRYQTSLKTCADVDHNNSTVTPDDVRTAQRTWLAYRDAYVRFASVAAPEVSRDAIVTRLTRLRQAELDKMPCNYT